MYSVYTHPPWIPKTVFLILSFLLVPIATPSSTEMFLQDLQESFQNKMLILQLLHTQLLISDSLSEPSVAGGRQFSWPLTSLNIVCDETLGMFWFVWIFSPQKQLTCLFFVVYLTVRKNHRRRRDLEFEIILCFIFISSSANALTCKLASAC